MLMHRTVKYSNERPHFRVLDYGSIFQDFVVTLSGNYGSEVIYKTLVSHGKGLSVSDRIEVGLVMKSCLDSKHHGESVKKNIDTVPYADSGRASRYIKSYGKNLSNVILSAVETLSSSDLKVFLLRVFDHLRRKGGNGEDSFRAFDVDYVSGWLYEMTRGKLSRENTKAMVNDLLSSKQ